MKSLAPYLSRLRRWVVRHRSLFMAVFFAAMPGWAVAQTPEVRWAVQAGGTGQFDIGYAMDTDRDGNVYLTGWFEGAAAFDDLELTSYGNQDVFVAKYDSDGRVLWARSSGGTEADVGQAIAVDANGDCYVTGSFRGSAWFGGTNLISDGGEDIFLSKYDADGNFLWTTRAGGPQDDQGRGITLDSAGSAHVIGTFRDTAEFNGTPLSSWGESDVFVAKYDSTGILHWLDQIGGSGFDQGHGIAVDSADNLYVTGRFQETGTFGDTELDSQGVDDGFLAKYDSTSRLEWVRQAGGTNVDVVFRVSIDAEDNSHVAGFFQGNLTIDDVFFTSSGGFDMFLAQFDPDGKLNWARQGEGEGKVFGNGIAVDGYGNVFVSGTFYDEVTFGATTLTSKGGSAESDSYLVKYDRYGNLIWAMQAGGEDVDDGQPVAIDDSGNIYFSGYFRLTGTFGESSLVSAGGRDIYLARIHEQVPEAAADPEFLWARGAGGPEDDRAQGLDIDSFGNSYITGIFRDAATFENVELTSRGGADVFLGKYDPTGDLLWIEQAGGSSEASPGSRGDTSFGVTVDGGDNLYVTGYYHGTATFGTTDLMNRGANDIFLAKYRSNGEFVWARGAGGSQRDTGLSVRADGFDNVGVVGYFRDIATFGDHTLTASPSPGGVRADAYVVKYDSNGDALWVSGGGGGGDDVAFDVAFDNAGNVFICGYIQETATFSGEQVVSAGGHDAFIANYDSDGTLSWIRGGGGSGTDIARAIRIDSAGNAYVLGTFEATADFDTISLTSGGGMDLFLAKYGKDGDLLWITQASASGNVTGSDLVLDGHGNVHVTGSFHDTVSFGEASLTSAGEGDIFVALYDFEGNFVRAQRAGGVGGASAESIALDARGTLYIAGQFQSTSAFGLNSLVSNGSGDSFLAKIDSRPSLQISSENGQPVVQWQAGVPGFQLQHTPTLSPADWAPVPKDVTFDNGIYQFLSPEAEKGFFRLAK